MLACRALHSLGHRVEVPFPLCSLGLECPSLSGSQSRGTFPLMFARPGVPFSLCHRVAVHFPLCWSGLECPFLSVSQSRGTFPLVLAWPGMPLSLCHRVEGPFPSCWFSLESLSLCHTVEVPFPSCWPGLEDYSLSVSVSEFSEFRSFGSVWEPFGGECACVHLQNGEIGRSAVSGKRKYFETGSNYGFQQP